MAVGARITSENLSGKTATVTFVPYTGVTSGTTVNLGSKTIPFNNINAHPYGIYSLYLAEYDYTYTLTIPEPVGNAQLFVYVDKIIGSNNYGIGILNFDDFTAEVIDLGVDSTYWNNVNVQPLQDSGFMHVFEGDSDYQEKLVIFTDVSGSEIGRYSGTTDNRNADSLNGRVLTYEDEDNGVLTYSNGRTVHTYTYDPLTHYIDIEWYDDAVTSDNKFIIEKWDDVPPLSGWTYNGPGSSYIVNPEDGTETLFKTWTDGTYVRHKMQANTDFIVVETEIQGASNSYTNFEIYDTSGTILETVSLTGATYNSRSSDFLGDNKYCAVYHNINDDDVDYKIIHYDGDTQTLTQTSHVHGTSYTDFSVDDDSDFWPNDSTLNGGVVIVFHNEVDNVNIGPVVTYCDFVYMLRNQTTFTTYQLADNVEMVIQDYGQQSNMYRTIMARGDFFEFLTITSTGQTITTTQIPFSGITYVNSEDLGDRTIYEVISNEYMDIDLLLVSEDGTILDTLSKNLNTQNSYNSDSERTSAYFNFSLSGGTSEGYYVYSGSTGFTSTGVYNTVNYAEVYYTDTFLNPGVMVLHSNGELGFRVLSLTGITSELSFPEYDSYGIRVGENGFMFVYEDSNDNGNVKINLYNLSGTLINSQATTYSAWDDTFGIKDRFVVKFNNEGYNEYFLVSEETITSVELDAYDEEWTSNDYLFWSDY
jgi:hypothetical protein